ncbi:helix-turn-helix domain-containing protein [Comamonas odontotermitis]|uniref:helix-turn-helix domain-containing protein n=1 Tax=Comamonas odontotermitis TaxID=379895 RepID=UPI00366C53A7
MTPLPTFKTFGERLAWWIDERGFSQKELAKQAGMSQGALSEICSGLSKRPSAQNFMALATLLKLRPEYLLWGDGPAEATSFAQLTGLEAQLVMLFRGLANDAQRDALLIDVNDAYNNSKAVKKATAADPFNGAKPAPSPVKEKAPKRTTKKASESHSH